MYTVTKRMEVSGAHCLQLPYESKCTRLHGHNWIIDVTCQREKLDENGMVVDFTHIKDVVMQLDHAFINDIVKTNPTAENIAKWIHDQIPFCTRVSVQESEGNVAIYEDFSCGGAFRLHRRGGETDWVHGGVRPVRRMQSAVQLL